MQKKSIPSLWLNRLIGRAWPRPLRLVPVALAAAVAGVAPRIWAANDTWNQTAAGAAYQWNNAANWQSGTQVPGSTTTDNADIALFPKLAGAQTNIVDNPRYIGGITFSNAAGAGTNYTLSGGPLFLNSGGTIQTVSAEGTHNDIISALVTLDGASGGTATFNSSGSANNSFMTFSGGVTGTATAGNTNTLTITGSIGTTPGSASTISGAVSDGAGGGALAMVKTGSGSWFVNSAASTFSGGMTIQAGAVDVNVTPGTPFGTGPVTISGGTLKIGNGAPRSFTMGGLVAASGGNGNVVVGTGGTGSSIITLNVPNGASYTYGGQLGGTVNNSIANAIGLVKTNSGTQILSGVNYYTNYTKIYAGKLIGVTGGSCVNSAVIVQSSGSGAAATFGVSYSGANAQWTCASLTTLAAASGSTAGPVLEFIFNTAPSATVAPLNVSGNATFDGSTAVTVDLYALGLSGNYPLMVVGGTAPTLVPALTVNGSYSGCSLAWGTAPFSANTLVLTVPATVREPLTWNTGSTGSGTWDINDSGNTVWQDAGGNSTYYQDNGIAGDQVVFDQTYTTASTVVTLNSSVTPSSIAVTNPTINYTISGTGSIGGTASLTKNGNGTLTLATANSYSGLTTVAGGELDLNSASGPAVGGNLTVSAGTAKLLQANQVNSARSLAVNGGVFNLQGNNQALAGVQLTSGSINGSGGILTNSGTYDLQAGSVSAVLAGSGALTKTTTGTVTLTGANTYTNSTTVSGGVLTVGSGGAINLGNVANGGQLLVGNATGNSTLNIAGGTVNVTKGAPGITVGNITGGAGLINLTSGSLTTASDSWIGAGGSGVFGFGAVIVSGGTFTDNGFLAIGRSGSGAVDGQARGELIVSGGSVTVTTNALEIGSFHNYQSNTCVATLTGGTLNIASTATWLTVGSAANGVLNVSGSAAVNINSASGLALARNTTNVTGIVNLNGGSITTPLVFKSGNAGAVGYFNFNGGTLRANTTKANFMTGLTAAYVYSGGAVIDDGGNAITIGQSLLSPATGSGVSASGLTVSGSGFIAPPIVDIIPDPSDTTGVGATAIATIDSNGNLTGVVMTSPGVNYTAPPNFMFTGGGSTVTQSGNATLVANTSGGLVKLGANTLTLAGANTYTGTTTVSNGTLSLTGSLAAGADVKNGGTLGGSGTIGGPVTVEAGATLSPGFGGTNAAALSINNNLTLAGTSLMIVNNTNTLASSQVLGVNTLTYGGTLTVANAGPALASGNTFQLFSATNYSGSFSATNLPVLAGGLSWNWNPASGTLSVVGGSLPSTGTNIQVAVSGNQLTLSWPASYTGWLLQSNSIDLSNSNDWFTVPGSATTNQAIITVNPQQSKAFYRMAHP